MNALKLKIFVIIIFGLLIFIILFQNNQIVSLRILFWKASMSRIIFIPLVMPIGFLVGFIVGGAKNCNL